MKKLCALAVAMLLTAAAGATLPGGVDPDSPMAQWYRSLKAPDTIGGSCCSIADCRPVEARQVGDHWEVLTEEGWEPVLPERVLHRENLDGRSLARFWARSAASSRPPARNQRDRSALEGEAGSQAEDEGVADDSAAVRSEHIAAGVDDVLQIGLQRPARLYGGSVAELDQRLVVAHRGRRPGETVGERGVAADPPIGRTQRQYVAGPLGKRRLEADAAIGVERHEVAVGGGAAEAHEHADALILRPGAAPYHLGDDAVDAPIAAPVERTRQLVRKRARFPPAAELVGAGQSGGVLARVRVVFSLGEPQRAAAQAERDAVRIADLRVAGAAPAARLGAEQRRADRHILGRLGLQPDARLRQRIGGAAAARVGGGQQRPAERAVDQAASRIAGDELGIGGELADPY